MYSNYEVNTNNKNNINALVACQTHGGPETRGSATDPWLADTEINKLQRLIKSEFPCRIETTILSFSWQCIRIYMQDQSLTNEVAATIKFAPDAGFGVLKAKFQRSQICSVSEMCRCMVHS